MARIAAFAALVLVTGCARGIVDEGEGSTTSDVPPSNPAAPSGGQGDEGARRISADAPEAQPAGTARASFEDPAGDATDNGVDIRRVVVSQDHDGVLEVVVEAIGEGNLDLYIDSDLNAATGVDGYDVRVSASSASGAVELWFQEGGTWRAESAPTFVGTYRDGKLVVRIHREYLGPEGSRGPIGIAVGAQGDRAPDRSPDSRYIYRPL